MNSEGLCFLTSLEQLMRRWQVGSWGEWTRLSVYDPKRITIHIWLYPHNRRLWGKFKGMIVLSWLLDHSLASHRVWRSLWDSVALSSCPTPHPIVGNRTAGTAYRQKLVWENDLLFKVFQTPLWALVSVVPNQPGVKPLFPSLRVKPSAAEGP